MEVENKGGGGRLCVCMCACVCGDLDVLGTGMEGMLALHA